MYLAAARASSCGRFYDTRLEDTMRTHRLVQWLVALAFLLASAFNSPVALARGQGHHSPDAVLAWNTHALYASITVANQFPVQSLIYMALTQAAVYNAVVAIDGRYEP